jgi:hypothetical protein
LQAFKASNKKGAIRRLFFSMSYAMPFSLKEWGLTANELSLATIATLISIFVALHY